MFEGIRESNANPIEYTLQFGQIVTLVVQLKQFSAMIVSNEHKTVRR